ncbi:MAG: RsmE family RNA methyltransferase [Myxococcota bacterium]|nr:RsmE family RNA methyltransferase [Myxococcota bacterium]
MSRSPWLFIESLPGVNETAVLPVEEGRHGGRSHRLRPGDTLTLTDGRGRIAHAELLSGDRRETRVRVAEVHEFEPTPSPLHVATAIPKGERMSTLLAMTTQLGITSYTPLHCERSVVIPNPDPPPRWDRIVRENAKQSHQAWMPEVLSASSPQQWRPPRGTPRIWILDPSGEDTLGTAAADGNGPQCLLIGPEGGFTSSEREALRRAGGKTVSLGGPILRIETAAVAAVSILGAALSQSEKASG